MTLLLLLLQTLSLPPDIWHDPIALALIAIGVAAVIGVAGVVATILAAIYPVRKQQRKIEFWHVSEAPIATLNETLASRIQVLLDGKPAEHARLRVIEVRNTGNTVRSEDYFEPLTFEFDEEVIGGEVLDTGPKTPIKPSDRRSFLTLGPKSVQLPPFPLRHSESIRFSVLLKGESKLRVRGRMDGTITEFDPLTQTVPVTSNIRLRLRAATIFGLLMFLIGGGLQFYYSQNLLSGDLQPVVSPGIGRTEAIAGNTSWVLFLGLLLFVAGFSMLVYTLLTYLNPHIKALWSKVGGR
jgi:hypothetical protein